MTCRELIDFLMEYWSGELSANRRKVFDAHLRACPKCVAYVKGYEEAVRLGKAVLSHPDERVPADVPEELVQAILAARRAPS